jgi:hypothetical protein
MVAIAGLLSTRKRQMLGRGLHPSTVKGEKLVLLRLLQQIAHANPPQPTATRPQPTATKKAPGQHRDGAQRVTVSIFDSDTAC